MKKFKKIYIEITNSCNLNCSFCQPSLRPKAFMRQEAFEKILREISGHTEYIYLHVLGEALLHPELEFFLALSHEYGLRVNLSTNGILLPRIQEVLLRQPALRQINISLHSFEEAQQEDALNSYLSRIFSFTKVALASSPLFINLRIWNIQKVAAGEQAMSSIMLRKLEEHFKLPLPSEDDFTPGRGIVLAPQVFLSIEQPFTWPHAQVLELGKHGYCRGLRDHIAILVDGTVVPCCLDAEADIRLGNIFQQTLPDIISGTRASMIVDGFSRQLLVEPLCRRCTYRQRFQAVVPAR